MGCGASTAGGGPPPDDAKQRDQALKGKELVANGTGQQLETKTQAQSQPAPPATTSNEQCGVSLSFLSWFGDYVDPNMSTREVVEHIIKVQTLEKRCSYLELLDQNDIGKPLVYVIHSWNRPFHKMVKVLARGLARAHPGLQPTELFVWIDSEWEQVPQALSVDATMHPIAVFAINQHGAPMAHEDLLNLQTTICACQSAMFCVDLHGMALTRTWVLWELWLVSATLGADKLHLMGGFLKGPDLVQKLKDLDISSASFTTNLSDKALLMASIEGAGHLPTFSASIRELLLEAARAAAISMEAASAAADEAARTAAAAAAEEAVKQEASSAGAGPTPTTSAADAKAAAEAAKQQAQDVQLDYALAVYRAAAVLEACGLQQEAHDLYRAALDISNEELGGEHAAVECNTLLGLAGTYKAAKQWEDAEECLRRVVGIETKIFGEGHPRVARDKVDLAIVLRRAGRLPEAEALFKEALKALDVPGKEPTCSLASVQMGLASVLRLRQQHEEAESLCRAALHTFESSLGPCHPKTIGALAQVVQVVQRSGRKADAQALLQELQERRQMLDSSLAAYHATHAEQAAILKAKQEAQIAAAAVASVAHTAATQANGAVDTAKAAASTGAKVLEAVESGATMVAGGVAAVAMLAIGVDPEAVGNAVGDDLEDDDDLRQHDGNKTAINR